MDRIKLLKEYLINEPDDDFLNYALALEYIKNEDLEVAETIFSEILLRNSKYLPVYFQLGKIFEVKNDTPKAVEIYTEGLKVAKKQNNLKTWNELKEAIAIISETDH